MSCSRIYSSFLSSILLAATLSALGASCPRATFAAASPMAMQYDRTADGEWAVVGASRHDGFRGLAYIYRHDGGRWVLDATLAPPERGPFARFGTSVAFDGNTLVVGAPWDDGWKGAAYVYERSAGTWILAAKLSPESSVGDRFGSRVSVADGVASLEADGGAVARFRRTETGWTESERVASGVVTFVPGKSLDAGLVGAVAALDERDGVSNHSESAAVVDTPAFVRATDGIYEDRTEIRWAPVSGGSYLFKIYRRRAVDPPSADVLIRVAAQNDSLYADATGRAGVVYTYSVKLLELTSNTEGPAASDNGRRIIFAPTEFSASDATYEGFVRLTWSDRSNIEAGYRIRRNDGLLRTTIADAQTLDDSTAVPGTSYTYNLIAFDAAGDSTTPVIDSGQSAFIAAPLEVSATDGQDPDKVVITWVDNTALEVNYRVYRNGSLRMTLPAGTQSFEDLTAASGTRYEYCVAAVDGSNRESARGCDFGGRGILPAPAHVTATIGTFDDKVHLAWQDTSRTEDGFFVYRNPPGMTDTTTLIANLGASVTTFDDAGGQPGQAYSYCVVAFSNRGGRSAPACDDGLRAVVITPTSVVATDGAFEDRVDIAWESTSTSVVLFKIYRGGVAIHTVVGTDRAYSDDGVPSGVTTTYAVTAVSALGVESPMATDNGFRRIAVPVSVTASDEAFEDHVAVTWTDRSQIEDGYFVYRRRAGTADPLQKIAMRPSNSSGYDDHTGVPGQRYDYLVTAFQAFGPGNADTTESDPGTDAGGRTLEVPTFVAATDGTFEDKIVLSWADNSRYEEAYQVWRRNLATNDSALAVVLPPNSSRYVDSTGIAFGSAYLYSVFAVDSLGGALLGRSLAGRDTGSTTILPPASVSASDVYSNKIVVAWIDQSSLESGYEIRRDGVRLGTTPANVTSFTDNTAGEGVTYTYCVRAVAAADTSDSDCDAGSITRIGGGSSDTTRIAFNDRIQTPPYLDPATPSQDLIAASLDWFGSSLGGDDERVIVGAPHRDETNQTAYAGAGKAYIYRKTGGGLALEQILAPPDTTINGLEFGAQVALEGTTALVFARAGWPSTINASVYFYELDPQTNVWNLATTVVLPGGGSRSVLSSNCLDISGEWAVIGVPSKLINQDFSGGIDRGQVNFYRRQGTGWVFSQTVTRSGTHGQDAFGASVALSGGTAIVGDPIDGELTPAAIFFAVDGSGTWTESQVVLHPAWTPGEYGFGWSVDIDGGRAVVGNARQLQQFTGGSYMMPFERDAQGVWRTLGSYSAPGGMRGVTQSVPGWSVSIHGGSILMGDPYDDVGSADRGAAYLFSRQDNGYWIGRELRSNDPQGNLTGYAVKLLDDGMILVGTPHGGCVAGTYACPMPTIPNVSHPHGAVEVLRTQSIDGGVAASDGTYKDRVQIKWPDPYNNETAFKVYRDGALIATTEPNVRSYVDFDAEPGRTHEYCVSATLDNGIETVPGCDFGRRPPDGNITGRVSTLAGAGVSGTEISLDPAPNRSMLFDGSGGALNVSDGNLFGDEFTVEFWYRGHAGAGAFLRHSSAVNADAFSVTVPANLTVFVNGLSRPTGVTVNDGAWHHVAIDRTKTDGALHVYKDGQLAYTGALSAGTSVDPVGSLTFGSSLSGAMDDIRIWSRVRTAAQIDSAEHIILTGSEPGLAAYWPLDAYVGSGAEEPVGNRYGQLTAGAHWISEAAPLLVFAVSDGQGNYVLPNLRYGTSTTFKVTPSISGHQFNPAFKTITLSTGSPVQNEVGFIDITSFTASGHVSYANTSCLAANVQIYVDGLVRGVTDGEGRYSVPVTPGDHTIEARLEGHTFSPSIIQLTGVASDVGGQDFVDRTVRHLSGVVAGGCNIPIGTLTLAIESEDRCFSRSITSAGDYAEALPPLKFFVRVTHVVAAPGGPDVASVIRFFDNLGAREVDLASADKTLDFKYRAPLAIEISGLPDPDPACTLGVPVIAQTERYPMSIRVYEDYGILGRCPVDTGSVTVFDEIIDQERTPVTLVVKDGEAKLQTDNGLKRYETAANTPNIFAGRVDAEGHDRSYQKSLTVVAKSEGQDPVTKIVWAIVTGHRPRAATFTAEADGIPLLILHDPPGDHSFSFMESESTFCTKISSVGLAGFSQAFEGKVHIGLDAILGFIFATKIKASFVVGGGLTVGVETKTGNEMEICAKTSQEYKTSADNLYIGQDGDVYMGLALNLIFAKTDVIRVQGCAVVPSVEVTFGVDKVQSVYNYTDWHIRNTIIPQLAELARLSPADSARFNSARENWEAHLALNDSLKRVAPLDRNRSFSAGAEYSYSSTVEEKQSSIWSSKVFTNSELSTSFEFKVSGFGGEGGWTSKLDFALEREGSTSNTNARTTGYTLSDDDIGDVFSVDVKKDVMYGTPIFDLAAGTTSCPWEPWPDPRTGRPRSQPVDGPHLTVEPAVRSKVPVGSPAAFTLNMTNDSQSGSLREYLILPIQESNPGGAVIKIDGLAAPNGVSFFIPPGETRQATMTVERGPNRYFYDDLEVAMLAPCEFELFRNGGPLHLADTVSVNVAFDAPCSDITLLRPQSGWSVGAGATSLDVILDGFQLAISEEDSLEAVGAEYQLAGTDAWLPIGDVPLASIPRNLAGEPQGVTINWPVTGVPAGTYSVRAFTLCGGGRSYSGPATGVIDRAAPQVFGTPEPADGVLSLGEDISITFNEDINCATANALNVRLETAVGTPQALDATVTCNGRTLVIAPTADLSGYEGQTLRATVSGIQDRVGNPMSSSRSWTFEVRQGEFAWAQSSASQNVGYGSGGRVAVNLVNGLSLPVRYTLSALPAWLAAAPVATDTIPAKSQSEVAFQINSATALGSYDTTITATATTVPPSFGRIAQLAVHVNVLRVPPTWVVSPADFEHSMTVRAKVYVGADSSVAPDDMLAAFVGDQVRGIAHPQHVSDGWRYFLTVYGKPPAYERMRFRVWDSRTSKTYVATDKTVKFVPDTTYGGYGHALEIRTRQPSPANEQVIPVSAGWTWFSVNRRPSTQDDRTVAAVLSNLAATPGDLVKAQDGSVAMFDATAGWIGTLDTLGVTKSYRLESATGGEIRYESARVLPSLFPIPVKHGWNWIGYTPDDTRGLTAALANYPTAASGDVLRSQTAFAEYASSTWAGSLATMGPGLGYALYRANALDGQLVYTDTGPAGPTLAGGAGVELEPAAAASAANAMGLPGWEVDYHAYQYDMVVTAELSGIALGAAHQVAALVEGEIRGVARPVHVAALDRTFIFLMVHSNRARGETVHFQVLDRTSGKVFDVAGTVGFDADAVLGTTASPVPLTSDGKVVANLGLPGAFELGLSHPNPLLGAEAATVRYGLPRATRVTLELFDVNGRRVRTIVNAQQSPGWYDITIEPGGLRGGVYFYRLRADSFSATRRMVVVR